MKKISLNEAYEILENCAAVTIDDNGLTYPGLMGLNQDEDNEFLHLHWNDDEGQSWDVKYEEGSNQEVSVEGTKMLLQNTEGEWDQITILAPMQIE